jgi:hypothetical protein
LACIHEPRARKIKRLASLAWQRSDVRIASRSWAQRLADRQMKRKTIAMLGSRADTSLSAGSHGAVRGTHQPDAQGLTPAQPNKDAS